MAVAFGSPLASKSDVTAVSFDLVADVETSILQATRSNAAQSFSALSPDERRHLHEWQTAAGVIGIDAVEDLASRPWPCPIADTVIGVFQTGTDAAPWLVIGHNGTWAVACCTEGTVSRTLHSLAEALAVIYPAGPEAARRACWSSGPTFSPRPAAPSVLD